ncbi:prepilin peptidase [Demequina aurantiaca]|uniref:prepilin peptidase n=1 Tax=Demequina aurantiaca TaxID=676200 RepID=UPI003D32902E
MALIVLVAGLLGLGLGSFANVVIYRVPAGESVVHPRSACPKCGHPIRSRHNIPVLSWLWLRRQCADCGAPISARYPLVELGTAVAFALIVGLNGFQWSTLLLLVFAYGGIILTAVDLDTMRLPNVLVGVLAIAAVASIILAAGFGDQWPDALRALIGAALLGLFYFVAWFFYPKGMGFGDVKLAPVVGATLAFFGWPQLIVGGFFAFVWGAIAGVLVMIVSKRVKQVKIPFGPWMFAGAWTGIILGQQVSDWYLGVVLSTST